MQVAHSDFFSQSRMGKSVEHISCSRIHTFDFLLSYAKQKGWTPHHCTSIQTLDHSPPRTKLGKKTLGGKRSWEGKTKLYTHNFVSSRPPTSFLIISVARCKYSIDISRFFFDITTCNAPCTYQTCSLQHILKHAQMIHVK